jgi:hypothetical protein
MVRAVIFTTVGVAWGVVAFAAGAAYWAYDSVKRP